MKIQVAKYLDKENMYFLYLPPPRLESCFKRHSRTRPQPTVARLDAELEQRITYSFVFKNRVLITPKFFCHSSNHLSSK